MYLVERIGTLMSTPIFPSGKIIFIFYLLKKNFFFNVDHFFKSLVNFVTKILFYVLVFWPRHVGF